MPTDQELVKEVMEGDLVEAAQSHPLHRLFDGVFQDLGGAERLKEWAEENYGQFIQLYARTSTLQSGGKGGRVIIQVNNQLGPSPLDE